MDNRIFYHLGLVSGFCSANDAPENVMDSIKKIEAAMLRLPVSDKLDEILEILRGKPVTRSHRATAAAEPEPEPEEENDPDEEKEPDLTDEEKVARKLAELAANPPKKERKPSSMSPINRAKAGWRLKRGQAYAAYVKESEANGETPDEKEVWFAEYEEKFPAPTEETFATGNDVAHKPEDEEEQEENDPESESVSAPPLPKKEPFREVPADRLISDHNEFICDRTDGAVSDSDWKDIQSMMFGGGMTSEQCRKKYGVQPYIWDNFIKRMEAREAENEKN